MMATCMNEEKLIGKLLRDEDSEEELVKRYTVPKRYVLLNSQELGELSSRCSSAPPEFLEFSPLFFKATGRSSPLSAFSEPFGVPEGLEDFLRLALSQAGSRQLQDRCKSGTDAEREYILIECAKHIEVLSEDLFGNYVLQRVIEQGQKRAVSLILGRLQGKLLKLALHSHGCRVVQKVLEYADSAQRGEVLGELQGHATECMEDAHGNYVVQKCLETCPGDEALFLLRALEADPVYWAVHPYGCRVLQKVIENYPLYTVQGIISPLLSRVVEISQKEFGNYVVQQFLAKGSFAVRAAVLDSFRGCLVALSCDKFASNVIEKCVSLASSERLESYTAEIFHSAELCKLMTDRYANFVVQRVISAVTGETQAQVLRKVAELEPRLRKSPQGRFVLKCAEKNKPRK